MIAVQNQWETELTTQQKYNLLRPKAIVEVRLLSHAGADEKWFVAKIKDTNKEGAYCQITTGTLTKFWHWREIRPCSETELPRTSATLGEITQTHLKPAPELPRREPLPAPQALRAALVPASAPPPPAPLVRLTRPEPIIYEPKALGGVPIMQQAEPLTAGKMVRVARQAAGLTQEALAAKLTQLTKARIDHKRVSALETGFRPPSETEQIAIVEALGIDLAQLIAACERDALEKEREVRRRRSRESAQRLREQRAAAEGREIAHRASKYRAPDAVAAVTPPSTKQQALRRVAAPRAVASVQSLEDLIEALIAIVPMPADADERKNWFRCARELFALTSER